jgi:hypothetical protein
MFLSQKLGCWRLNHTMFVDDERFVIYCFPQRRSAECFLKAFFGEWITPQERIKATWRSRNVRMMVGKDISCAALLAEIGEYEYDHCSVN